MKTPNSEHASADHAPLGDLATFVAAWVPYALLTWRLRFVCDDAFISFRYARNLAGGHGLRYNLGEHVPVEGYSNFLWVLICAGFERLGAEITVWPLLVSFACGSILVYLVLRALRRLGLDWRIALAATLLFSCSPIFACWSTSGLATAPFALLIFLSFDQLVLRRQGVAPVAAGIAGLTLALLRVEGIYWALLLAPIACLSRRLDQQKCGRRILLYLGIVISGYALYWVWRYGYHELPFANTAYAKSTMSRVTLVRGIKYVLVQYLTFPPLLVVVPGSLLALRRKRWSPGLAVAAMAAGFTAYAVVVGGDFMSMARLLAPGLAFLSLLFAWMLADLGARWPRWRAHVFGAGLLLVAAGLLPGFNVHLTPRSLLERLTFRYSMQLRPTEYEMWAYQKGNALHWAEEGKLLKVHVDPDATYVRDAIGAVGYYSELFIHDQIGLVNREVAARPGSPVAQSPGHDKRVPVFFFLDQKPDVLYSALVPREILIDFVADLKTKDYVDRYVASVPASIPYRDGRVRYLLLCRRIEDGVTPARAWRTFDRHFNELVSGAGE